MSVMDNRVSNLFARGIIESVDDEKGVQTLTVRLLNGERRRGVERMQSYGTSSVPLPNSEVLVSFPNGDRSAGIAQGTEDRATRMTALKPGEVGIYTHEGDSIILGAGNEITITTKRLIINAAERVTVTCPIIEFNP